MVFTTDWNPNDTIIAPGDSLELNVSFAPADTIAYSDRLEIQNNDALMNVTLEGTGQSGSAVAQNPSSTPITFALAPPVPNPFNPSTALSFKLQAASNIKLAIYDIAGRDAAVLVEGFYPAGEYQAIWDASKATSGIYIAKLRSAGHSQARKLILVK